MEVLWPPGHFSFTGGMPVALPGAMAILAMLGHGRGARGTDAASGDVKCKMAA
jgi:hypothetical protein